MKFTKIIAILTASLLLAWLLPWTYNFIFSKPFESDLTLYSCVKKDFMTFEFHKKDVAGYDMEGNAYTPKEFDSLMPTLFYYELNKDNRLPKEIDGIEFDVHAVEMSNFVFRTSPSRLNRPSAGLYQLFDATAACEALSTTPEDVFRVTDHGIEFINMARNEIDEKKSHRFTQLMRREGFEFPAKYLNASTEARKRYDNGYLILDQKGQLFQLKRYRYQPYFRKIDIPDSIHLTHVFVTEFADHRLLGFLRDSEGGFYALENEVYTLHRLPLRPIDPARQQLVITGDMYYWNAIEETSRDEHITAINAQDYSFVKSHYTEFPRPEWDKRREWFFPFRLQFTASTDKYLKPRFKNFTHKSLGLNILLTVFYLWMRRRQRHKPWIASIAMLWLGIYLFVPLVMTDRK